MVAPVERKDIEITVSATSLGTLKAENEVKITAQRPGRISRLHVEEGDRVKAGASIAELDPEESLIRLDNAKAAVSRAQARFEQLKIAYDPMHTDTETAIIRAEADLKKAGSRYERIKDLADKGLVSQSELDSAERDYKVARAAYESALGGREKFRASGEQVKAQASALKEAREDLKLARLEYGYSFVKTPIAGVVSSRPVKLGETLQQGGLIAEVIDMNSIYLEAFIDEVDVGRVRPGQTARVTMDAFPDRVFSGKVYMISPLVTGKEHEAKTFEVRIKLDDPGRGIVLKPGMSADVEILVERMNNALVVPVQSIFEKEDGRKFLYVAGDGKARLREVTTGSSSLEYTSVLSGVRLGEKVVLTPDVTGLVDGARVKVESASH